VKSLAVVAALAGCASSPTRVQCGEGWAGLSRDRGVPKLDVQPREVITIERVRITGVDERLAATLRTELATKPGATLDDAPIGDDLRRLWKLGVIEDASVAIDGGEITFELSPRRAIMKVVRKGGDALAQSRFRRLEGTPFEPSRVRRMAEALQESYLREGRLDAQVEAKQREHATGVDVCVAANPGARITIAKLEFPGAKSVTKKALLDAMHGKESKVNRVGGAFDATAIEMDEWLLQAEFWEHGHLDVKIGKPTVKRRGSRLDVAIPIDEGPRYRIGTIDTPIAIPLRSGDLFRRSRVVAAVQAIEKAGNPTHVYPQTHVDKDALRVDITFDIEWRYPWDALRFWLSRSR